MDEAQIKSKTQPIGAILRLVREKLGKKQGDIAAAADISISMLSQIERGAVSPSIDTLMAVCAALNLDMSDLFRRIAPLRPVRLRHEAQRLFTKKNGVRYEQLVLNAEGAAPIEMFLLELDSGKQTGLGGVGHEGIEMGYVLKGNATMNIGGEMFEIKEGDSLSYSAHTAHVLMNTGKEKFCSVWSVSPPHKDYLEME